MFKRASLLNKFLIVISFLLLLSCLIIVMVIQLIAEFYISPKLRESTYVQQQKVDEVIYSIIYETIGVYTRMFNYENVLVLIDEDNLNKDEQFLRMYQESRINYEFYEGVVTILSSNIYKSNPVLDLPDSLMQQNVLESNNYLNFAGVIKNKNQSYVILGKRIIDVDGISPHVYGAVYFYLKEDVLHNLCKQVISSDGDTFLVNNSKYVFSHPNKSLIDTTIYDRNLYNFLDKPSHSRTTFNNLDTIVIISPLTVTNEAFNFSWHIVTEIPSYIVYGNLNNLVIIIILITISMLLIAFLVSIRLIKGLLKPINKLSLSLSKFSFNEKRSYLNQENKDELYILEKTYNEMIDRIFALLEKNKKDMEIQRKLELDSLQMQINPHFLYNTLDAIAWMAKIKKQTEIEKLVLSLAKFFRISLHKGDKYISVKEEIELIQHFIEIELFRFPNKFEVSYEVEDKIKDAQTLKLLLQPIVENAIKHGISPITKMGHITIKAYSDNDDIVFEVIDDGVGFNPPEDILIKTKEKKLNQNGYGLINVNERIKLEYGEGYGLTINSTLGGGTKVIVRIKNRG